jgi:hypothetical protein
MLSREYPYLPMASMLAIGGTVLAVVMDVAMMAPGAGIIPLATI